MAVSFAFTTYEYYKSSFAGFSLMNVLQSWIGLGAGAAAIILSALLCRHPKRALAFMLAVLSLFVFWRFYVGVIFLQMLPKTGGLTFGEAVADYWERTNRNVFLLLGTVPFEIFVAVSIIFWPIYGFLYGDKKDDNVA